VTKLTPTARLILKTIQAAAQPIHAGDILKDTGCSIGTLKESLELLTRLGLISRADLNPGPSYEPVMTGGVAHGV
jgi:DNA-binding HxlR family transcriptional regulator